MHPTLEKVLTDKPVIIDGAWGTQFQLLGLGSGESPDLWNLSHPDRVLKVAKGYVDAGSQVIISNTFGSNRNKKKKAGGDPDQVFEINKAGAAISRQACEGTDCACGSGYPNRLPEDRPQKQGRRYPPSDRRNS